MSVHTSLLVWMRRYVFDVVSWSEDPTTLMDPQMLKVCGDERATLANKCGTVGGGKGGAGGPVGEGVWGGIIAKWDIKPKDVEVCSDQ